jgi:RimK family alpha-L-glutamate ligase
VVPTIAPARPSFQASWPTGSQQGPGDARTSHRHSLEHGSSPRVEIAAPRIVLVSGRMTRTNARLVNALGRQGARATWRPAANLSGERWRERVVLARLDVRRSLDGVEDGWDAIARLERDGVHVLNPTRALGACHDKLATATALARVGVTHPRTTLITRAGELPPVDWPIVLKPRFGSWGREVVLLRDRRSLDRHLKRIRNTPWFVARGALLQTYLPAGGTDLRVVIAAGAVIGAISHTATAGDWRTNVSLGAQRRPAEPPAAARELALAAVETLDVDLAGVDLLRRRDNTYVVLEVNGAVDFTRKYSLTIPTCTHRAAHALLHRVSLADQHCHRQPVRSPAHDTTSQPTAFRSRQAGSTSARSESDGRPRSARTAGSPPDRTRHAPGQRDISDRRTGSCGRPMSSRVGITHVAGRPRHGPGRCGACAWAGEGRPAAPSFEKLRRKNFEPRRANPENEPYPVARVSPQLVGVIALPRRPIRNMHDPAMRL